MAKSAPEFSQLEFAWKVHAYTNDYIRFADTKAAFYLALAGGLLACLYTIKAHELLHPRCIDPKNLSVWVTFISLLSFLAHSGLILCCLFSAWAVIPRLWKDYLNPWQRLKNKVNDTLNNTPAKPGLIFWDQVLTHTNQAEYSKAMAETTHGEAVDAVTSHIHALAGVCSAKYFWLNLAWLPGAFGVLMAFLYIVSAVKT